MHKLERIVTTLAMSLLLLLGMDGYFVAARQGSAPQQRRNVIIFVADGLRYNSVNAEETPALWFVRQHGVNFPNSHGLYPTLTTPNASAIATGHGLGDTGNFANTIWAGYSTFESGNFALPAGTPTPFLESNRVLGDLSAHYEANYLHEMTLMKAAMAGGYNTASVGKVGPVAIQQTESLAPIEGRFRATSPAIVIDDATGSAAGFPLPPAVLQGIINAGLSTDAPDRNNGYPAGSVNNNGRDAGTLRPNLVQQQWFSDVTTRVILPMFQQSGDQPFFLLYWSRDPDGTEHNQADSLGTLYPGINGPSSKAAIQHADRNLQRILDWLDANPSTKANTDLFITSDHGFATVSRMEIDRNGRRTRSESAKHYYLDSAGNVETEPGTLPAGFLAIDLAFSLHTNLYDPDRRAPEGVRGPYHQIRLSPEIFERPQRGNGLLGNLIEKPDGSDAKVIVAANGGSDLIYVPDKNPNTVREVVSFLTTYDYVGGIFVDDQFGKILGAIPLSAIGLAGASPLPRPAIVVAFKVFYLNPDDVQTAIQIADGTIQEGQGNHGGLGRESTWINMAAIGPDFKSGYVDEAPVGNIDIVPTIGQILAVEIPSKGSLRGRVIIEALKNGPAKIPFTTSNLSSEPSNGRRTILHFQEVAGQRYIDRACFVASETQLHPGECP